MEFYPDGQLKSTMEGFSIINDKGGYEGSHKKFIEVYPNGRLKTFIEMHDYPKKGELHKHTLEKDINGKIIENLDCINDKCY